MGYHYQQSTPPPEPALPLPFISTTSPGSSASPHLLDDLSARCRQLARSVGKEAAHEFDTHYDSSPSRPQHHSFDGAGRASPPGSRSPARSPHLGSTLLLSPISPRASFATPDSSSFILDEILEEEGDGATGAAVDDKAKETGRERETSAGANTSGDEMSEDSHSRTRGHRSRASNSLRLHNLEHEASLRASLAEGTTCIKADVWLVDGDLLVGHQQSALHPENSLNNVYLEPLLHTLLPSTTTASVFSHHRRRSSSSSSLTGFASTSRPLLLHLDLRTSPSMTFQFLLHALTPLLDASLLTSYCPKSNIVSPGLVTVVCGGDAIPIDEIRSLSPRYVFYEADLLQGVDHAQKDLTPVASASLAQLLEWDGVTSFTPEQSEKLKSAVEEAHGKGVKVRTEGWPSFPAHTREQIKESLLAAGVDYI